MKYYEILASLLEKISIFGRPGLLKIIELNID